MNLPAEWKQGAYEAGARVQHKGFVWRRTSYDLKTLRLGERPTSIDPGEPFPGDWCWKIVGAVSHFEVMDEAETVIAYWCRVRPFDVTEDEQAVLVKLRACLSVLETTDREKDEPECKSK